MTYATLMVHLELGRPNANLLKIVGDLAAKFHAGVIGIAACQPLQLVYGDGYVSGDVVEQDQAEIQKEVGDAEKEFRSALYAHAGNVQWRSDVTMRPLSDYVAWLKRHGVIAEPLAGAATGEDADQLAKFVQERQADVMVAGAFGHSRLREWVLGGVTHDLACCSLVSH